MPGATASSSPNPSPSSVGSWIHTTYDNIVIRMKVLKISSFYTFFGGEGGGKQYLYFLHLSLRRSKQPLVFHRLHPWVYLQYLIRTQ